MSEAITPTTLPDPNVVKEEMLKLYPPKTRKKRAKQIFANDPAAPPEIAANTRTIPGIISQRGCTYAGCRGVVMGPIYDLLQITHGPVGCGFYAWMSRRNLARPKPGETNYMQYCMNTDMQEDQIIFGGEKKLIQAIREAYAIFKPKAIAILATCPVGLIGDDIHTVARQMKEELGINVLAFSCEGYKGVSQSAGHHIANNGVFKNIIGLDDKPDEAEFTMNILGEYNIGGDAWEIDTLLRKCGIHVTSTLSGDVSYEQVKKSHTVMLNGVMCHRSINYIADMMEKKFGIPWIKVNFIGAEAAKKTLRKIAKFFDDKYLYAGLTYSGHALACAAALATIQVYEEEKIFENSKKVGKYLGKRLEELKTKHLSVGDVRYIGLFSGIELVKDRQTKEPLDLTPLKNFLISTGLYVFNFKNILFVVPPLIINEKQLDEGLNLVDEGLSEFMDKLVAWR